MRERLSHRIGSLGEAGAGGAKTAGDAYRV